MTKSQVHFDQARRQRTGSAAGSVNQTENIRYGRLLGLAMQIFISTFVHQSKQKKPTVAVRWIRGNCGIYGNELADNLATDAAAFK